MQLIDIIEMRKHVIETSRSDCAAYTQNMICNSKIDRTHDTIIFDYRRTNKELANMRMRPMANGRSNDFEHEVIRLAALLSGRMQIEDRCSIWLGDTEKCIRAVITLVRKDEEPTPYIRYEYNPNSSMRNILHGKTENRYTNIQAMVLSKILEMPLPEQLKTVNELLNPPFYEDFECPLEMDSFNRHEAQALYLLYRKEHAQIRTMQTSHNPILAMTSILASGQLENAGEYTESYTVALAAMAAQLPARITDEMIMRAVLDSPGYHYSWRREAFSLIFEYLCWTNDEERVFQYLHPNETKLMKEWAMTLKKNPELARGKLVKVREAWGKDD
jgi:hypothetical protein